MSHHRPSDHYDAVIVGARAAGAATGLLLARAGLRVLVVDRSRYGADTLSTHALMRAGVLQLQRWGLLDAVVASGAPPVRRTAFYIGSEPLTITIKPSYGVDALYAPRRTVLDRLLVDAARAAGAEILHGFTVTERTRDPSGRVTGIAGHDERGRSVAATAPVTIGADGMSSSVARWVSAPTERVGSAAGAVAYGYWSGVEVDGYEWFFRPGAAAGAIPTNDGQTCVFVGTTPQRFRRDLATDANAGYLAVLDDAAPELFDRLAGATPPAQILRFPGRAGHMRRAWGPGWALVGDAGYFKDPITAHGLTDALRDAELLARAVVAAAGGQDEAAALADYQRRRDRLSGALFTVGDAIASYAWDETEIGTLLRRLSSAMVDEVETLAALDQAVPALAG